MASAASALQLRVTLSVPQGAASLRKALPIGTPVRLSLRISVAPDGPGGCGNGNATTRRAAVKVKVAKVLVQGLS
jgi:hypothetical protein